jgi:hypothetical protein
MSLRILAAAIALVSVVAAQPAQAAIAWRRTKKAPASI